jgi:hypothetical protein
MAIRFGRRQVAVDPVEFGERSYGPPSRSLPLAGASHTSPLPSMPDRTLLRVMRSEFASLPTAASARRSTLPWAGRPSGFSSSEEAPGDSRSRSTTRTY